MPKADTQFKPGQSGNIAGRAKLPPELQQIRSLTKDEVARLIGKYARMTTAEVKAATTGDAPIMEKVICRILLEAALEGDYSRLGFLLDRTIGKVKDEVEVSMPKPFIIERLDGSQTILGSSLENPKELE